METLNLYQPQYTFHTETPINELIALNNKASTNELTTLHTETLHTKAIANGIIITNDDLNKTQYTEKELIDNIDNLFQCIIVKSQRNLSNHFINNYILNPKYNSISKDEDITMETLNLYQPQYTFHS
jgi:NurA-like 5'-3' nuclease